MSYLTFKDIAQELQVSLRTVSPMVADGLPVVHVHGRVYRVHRNALDEFLRRRTRCERPSDLNWNRIKSSSYSDGERELLAMLENTRTRKRRSSSK